MPHGNLSVVASSHFSPIHPPTPQPKRKKNLSPTPKQGREKHTFFLVYVFILVLHPCFVEKPIDTNFYDFPINPKKLAHNASGLRQQSFSRLTLRQLHPTAFHQRPRAGSNLLRFFHPFPIKKNLKRLKMCGVLDQRRSTAF